MAQNYKFIVLSSLFLLRQAGSVRDSFAAFTAEIIDIRNQSIETLLPPQGPVSGGNKVNLMFSGGIPKEFVASWWIRAWFGVAPAAVISAESGEFLN